MHRRVAICPVPAPVLALLLILLTGCSAGQSPASSTTALSAAPGGTPAGATSERGPSPATSPSTTSSATPSPSPVGTVVELSYAGGEVTGDTGRVRLRSGEPVTLQVTSDVAEQVHVHGVDLYVDLAPGRTATARFSAPPPGVYELELHDAGTVLTRMQVT